MLALRDQENLIHGHQQAAASKPLNQGNRQLQPKTPGNKAPKTPFKVPLNDENKITVLGGKSVLRNGGKGNENAKEGGKKGVFQDNNNFVTPMGPRTRAPLGAKTTNAKAKAFATPGPAGIKEDPAKTNRRSISSKKPKIKPAETQSVKIDVLKENELEERDIEYMPPPAKNLPYYPDDHIDVDLSMFQGNFTEGMLGYILNRPDADGLSTYERQELWQNTEFEKGRKRDEAAILKAIESESFSCLHEPECEDEECRDMGERRRKAEEKYLLTIAEIDASYATTSLKKPSANLKGPTATVSKKAASSLSIPRKSQHSHSTSVPVTTKPTGLKARLPTGLLASKKPIALAPTNPSSMRHAAAVAASNSTLGYTKGRATSSVLRKNGLSSSARATGSKNEDGRFGKTAEKKNVETSLPTDEEEVQEVNEDAAWMDRFIQKQAEEEFELTW